MSQGSDPNLAQSGQPPQPRTIHMKQNSDNSLDDLFSVIQNPSVPKNTWKTKNLPSTFFKEPVRSSHSRENSQDATFGAQGQGHFPNPVHVRSRSSPAQLPNSALTIPPPHHVPKQNSVDFTNDKLSLPAGWDVNPDSLRNFQYNTSQSQPWAPPTSSTKSLSTTALNQQQQQSGLSPNHSHNQSPNISMQNLSITLGPLPTGWELSLTHDEEIYFINHHNKTTSWFHPNQPKHLQGQGPIKLSQLHPSHQQQVQQIRQQQQQQQQQNAQLLAGQQILLQNGQQQQPAAPGVPPRAPAPPAPGQPGLPPTEQDIQMQLRRLAMERERLQREQEDIARKERLLQQQNRGQPGPRPNMPAGSNSQTPNNSGLGIISEANGAPFQETMLKSLVIHSPQASQSGSELANNMPDVPVSMHSNVDPFMGQGGTTSEHHARQNSADSGLGGMGNNSYSLPRTPEDILSHVDEMDTQDNIAKAPKSNDFNMNDMHPTVGPMDIGGITDADGDALVSTLQDDAIMNPELLFNDVDGLTWL